MTSRITRRSVLAAAIPAGLTAAALDQPVRKARELARVGEFVRLIDPTTENTIVRLTALSSVSYLSLAQNRFISARSRFLVFSSDRTGKLAPYHLDLRSGAVRQIAETEHLDPSSLCLDVSERSLFFIDGNVLTEVQLSSRRTKRLGERVNAFSLNSADNLIVIQEGKLRQLGGPVLTDAVEGSCLLRPQGDGCLVERKSDSGDTEFWFVSLNRGATQKPMLLAKGDISFPFWTVDGQSVLFLRRVKQDDVSLREIHQVLVSGCCEQRLSATSQFEAFAPNRDGSVFVGASRSKAQPNVVLLLRNPPRELTICEHHAKSAASVRPVFSPDSRRVYFQSDREGKSAIYSVNVELLVEPTTS